jgi:hypothetical protein
MGKVVSCGLRKQGNTEYCTSPRIEKIAFQFIALIKIDDFNSILVPHYKINMNYSKSRRYGRNNKSKQKI